MSTPLRPRVYQFYDRRGRRVSERTIQRARDSYALAKGITGKLGPLSCSIQPEVADAIQRMSLFQFALWSGSFTWREIER